MAATVTVMLLEVLHLYRVRRRLEDLDMLDLVGELDPIISLKCHKVLRAVRDVTQPQEFNESMATVGNVLDVVERVSTTPVLRQELQGGGIRVTIADLSRLDRDSAGLCEPLAEGGA